MYALIENQDADMEKIMVDKTFANYLGTFNEKNVAIKHIIKQIKKTIKDGNYEFKLKKLHKKIWNQLYKNNIFIIQYSKSYKAYYSLYSTNQACYVLCDTE
jgi:phosphopantetheine adenylyltransferase